MSQLVEVSNSNIQYPIQIEGKNYADPKAARSLLALMNMHAVIGGAACHWGGPSGIAEILSALHQTIFEEKDWFNHFNLVNDMGHAENIFYAFKALYKYDELSFEDLKGFRSLGSKLTGHGESHLYPEGVLLSNGPLGSSVPQAQGLAMSDKLLKNKRMTISILSDGGAMEGEAKEALAAIPGLHNKGQLNPFLMIVSDNNTKLSGRMDGAFSMKPTMASFEALGWKVLHEEKGNDLKSCITSLELAINSAQNTPTVLILKTIKGKGVKSTEESASGGHGYPLKAYSPELPEFMKEIWENAQCPEEFLTWAQKLSNAPAASKPVSSIPKEKMQVGVSKALIDLKASGFPIISLSSDLQGSTGLAPFHKAHPESSFDLGIAESNMVGAAAGFSKNGFIPVVDTFAAFGVTKGSLPLIMASLSQAPMVCIFSHAGFQDAADGASHQSLTYFSSLASIPNVELIYPSNSDDTYKLITQAIKKQSEEKKKSSAKSYVFFLGRETFPLKNEVAQDNAWGDQLISAGSDLLIAATGPLLHEALEAKEILKEKGINVGIVNHRFLNTIDTQAYKNWLASHGNKLITLEDHQVNCGIGSKLIHELSLSGINAKFKSLGIKGEFGQSAYKAKELYAKHCIDSVSIAKTCEEFSKS